MLLLKTPKILTLLFSFFGIYFFYCSQAQANTVDSQVPDLVRVEHSHAPFAQRAVSLSKYFSAHSQFATSFDVPFICRPQSAVDFSRQSILVAPGLLAFCGVRDFFIRTGLSPPVFRT
jgi:hypothetical protein